jgi:HPt (histidine-containing phosphotransfer) domain-containing protein
MLRAGAGRYHLVLMDMQMPVMDGFTATRILRQELGLALPIIAMTAGVLDSERSRSMEAGITDFIPKPIEVEQMLEVIARHLPPRPAAPMAAANEAPAPDPEAFNMDSLMKVMGRDAKGRGVMVKMVSGALEAGMAPVEQAGLALQEGRPRDAAKLLHGLRGSVGVLGAKRLIQATIAAEAAINEGRADQAERHYLEVKAELELTLALAAAWLRQQGD